MRNYRSVYPRPWVSTRGLSRLLGVHPADIHRARALGLIREGEHFKLASTTRSGKHLYIFHYDRMVEYWPHLRTMVSESYRLGVLTFRRKLKESGVDGFGGRAERTMNERRRYPINEVGRPGSYGRPRLPITHRLPLCWAEEHGGDELECAPKRVPVG